jgi:hypothetical protein
MTLTSDWRKNPIFRKQTQANPSIQMSVLNFQELEKRK